MVVSVVRLSMRARWRIGSQMGDFWLEMANLDRL